MKHAPVKSEVEAAKIINELYVDAQTGLRRIVALGTFCCHWKAQLDHGDFQSWLEANCPKVSYRSVAVYMQITQGVFESIGLPMGDYFSKVQQLHFSHPGELLLLPEAKLPDDLRPFQQKAFDLIDGNSQRSLILKLKSNNSLGGFHPPEEDVQAWLKKHHPELLTKVGTDRWAVLRFADLPEAIQKEFRAQWKPKPISAADRAAIAEENFRRTVNAVAKSLDEKQFAHASVETRRLAKDLFRDYYKALSGSLKGQKGKRK
jgi:hypothetical protein